MDELEQDDVSEDEAIARLCERLNDEVNELRARLAALEREARIAAEAMRDIELAIHRPRSAAERLASIAMAWSRYTTALAKPAAPEGGQDE